MMKRVVMRKRMGKVLQSVFQQMVWVVEVVVAALAAVAMAVVKVVHQEGRMVKVVHQRGRMAKVVHQEGRSVASSSKG